MSATKAVEAVRKLFHFSRDGFRHYGEILVQHRREIDEFRSRLDTIQKTDTTDRRRIIVPPTGTTADGPRERVRGLWRGVWRKGTRYESGALVTHAGSLWHANAATEDRPGDGATDWVLVVKRGEAEALEK